MFSVGSCPDWFVFQFETLQCFFSAFPFEPAHDPATHLTPQLGVWAPGGSSWEPGTGRGQGHEMAAV